MYRVEEENILTLFTYPMTYHWIEQSLCAFTTYWFSGCNRRFGSEALNSENISFQFIKSHYRFLFAKVLRWRMEDVLTLWGLEVPLALLVQLLSASLGLPSLVPVGPRLSGELLGLKIGKIFIIGNLLTFHFNIYLLGLLSGLIPGAGDLSNQALVVHLAGEVRWGEVRWGVVTCQCEGLSQTGLSCPTLRPYKGRRETQPGLGWWWLSWGPAVAPRAHHDPTLWNANLLLGSSPPPPQLE